MSSDDRKDVFEGKPPGEHFKFILYVCRESKHTTHSHEFIHGSVMDTKSVCSYREAEENDLWFEHRHCGMQLLKGNSRREAQWMKAPSTVQEYTVFVPYGKPMWLERT